MRELTMGSLFSGLGGFELASVRNGICPSWTSDIEPYPIAVTRNHFPKTRHVGSVTEICGAELEPVDIITFGSPCQDLSVAGKQAGIHEGARSSLFFEAIRIIREMREKDIADGRTGKFIRPRFAVWENVPNAFSINKGADFQAVLQAFCNIRGGPSHIVPLPPKGKWLPAGNIVGNGFSLAWRVLDAAGWGVPQRRKRIFLVADFAGERAAEILFDESRLHGHPAPGGETGEGTAACAERSAGRSGVELNAAAFMGGQGAKAGSIAYADDGSTPTIKSAPSGGNTVPDVVYPINTMVATRGGADDGRTTFGVGEANDPQFTLSSAHEHAVCFQQNQREEVRNMGDKAGTVSAEAGAHQQNYVCYGVDCRNAELNEEKTMTLQAHNNGGYSLNCTTSVVYRQDGFAGYKEGVGTLKASGGDNGGGTESIVVKRV